jgi:NAD-dependent SIR2 family protein deacetylase
MVLEFCNRLRADGVDAYIDRYEPAPPQGWPRWMVQQVESADFVLLICTDSYRKRFEGKLAEGAGVRWEGALITQELFDDVVKNTKFIPVIFGESTDVIPLALRPYTFYRFPQQYDALYRYLTDQPEVSVPTLGQVRTLPTRVANPPIKVRSQGAVELRLPKETASLSQDSLGHTANAVHIASLQSVWRSGRLSVVAGAGVSVESGLPTWNSLLRTMLAEFVRRTYAFTDEDSTARLVSDLEERLGQQSPIVYAQFIRSQFADDEFVSLVHRALYDSNSNPKPGRLCRAIARLGHHLNSILTFNYDDLLEQALTSEGYECTAIYDADLWSSASGIRVYHPHGYLPSRRDQARHYPIVLAEADYHSQYYSPHLWSNVAISRVLLESTCLFVGTSLTDPNIRRLLDASHREQRAKTHYIIAPSPVRKDTGTDSVIGQAVVEVFAASYQQLGIVPLWFDDYADIPDIVDSIRDLSQ